MATRKKRTDRRVPPSQLADRGLLTSLSTILWIADSPTAGVTSKFRNSQRSASCLRGRELSGCFKSDRYIFENSKKTKRAAIAIHRLLQYARDNSEFSGRQTFEISYNFQQQMALQSGKNLNCFIFQKSSMRNNNMA